MRECGQILGVTKRLPEDCRSAKHVLEHILTQVAEFKKFNQARTPSPHAPHSHCKPHCSLTLHTHKPPYHPHSSPTHHPTTHTPHQHITLPPTLLTNTSPYHPHSSPTHHPTTHTPHQHITLPPTLLTNTSPYHPHSSPTHHPTTHTPHQHITLPPTLLTNTSPYHPHSSLNAVVIVSSSLQEPFSGGVAPTPIQDDL